MLLSFAICWLLHLIFTSSQCSAEAPLVGGAGVADRRAGGGGLKSISESHTPRLTHLDPPTNARAAAAHTGIRCGGAAAHTDIQCGSAL